MCNISLKILQWNTEGLSAQRQDDTETNIFLSTDKVFILVVTCVV